MNVEKMGNGFVMVGIKKEELEESIEGLSQLKPVLQEQVIKENGKNKKQALIDSKELGGHFDTAIMAMKVLLAGFDDEGGEQMPVM